MGMFVSSSLSWGEPLSAIVEKAHELGVEGVEIWAEQAWSHGDDPDAVREVADRLKIGRTVHGPSWDLNLCSIDPWMLRASRECSKEAVKLAARLGASTLIVHPGRSSLNGHFEEYHWAELRRSYEEICVCAADYGITIGLEAMERIPKELLCDPASVNRFVEEIRAGDVSNLGIVADVAHLTTLGAEPLRALGEFRNVVGIHISNARPEKLHTPLDEGTIDMASMIPALESRYALPIVIEGISVGRGYDLLERNVRAYRSALR